MRRWLGPSSCSARAVHNFGGLSELRVLFAFDPKRKAILLIAGDKAGNWKKWYLDNIPVADNRFNNHLKKLKDES